MNFLYKSIQETRLKAYHNLQIQLLMKQGQVEVNPGAYVPNFDNCLLIHRNVVESLNKAIQVVQIQILKVKRNKKFKTKSI